MPRIKRRDQPEAGKLNCLLAESYKLLRFSSHARHHAAGAKIPASHLAAPEEI